MSKYGSLLNDVQVLAIVCNQWGDTGKGKFVDYFSEWADVIARGTGGNNAGHTIRIRNKEYILHLMPSVISDRKMRIIGNGVIIDPRVLGEEMDFLDKEKVSYYDNFFISGDAHVIMPYHIALDKARDFRKGIGTTGRGIGPCYTDKTKRGGIRINDLLDKDRFKKKLKEHLAEKEAIIKHVHGLSNQDIKELLEQSNLGIYYKRGGKFDLDAIMSKYGGYTKRFEDRVWDTKDLIHKQIRAGKRILLEGAQGILLSIEYGTDPFVTPSDCSVNGLVAGVGINGGLVDKTLGIVKAFYKTRVGNGPFPTEFVDEAIVKKSFPSSEELKEMGKTHKEWEAERYNRNVTLSEIAQGNQESLSEYCRVDGGEYGATTGRPRRTGWLDLVALRYALKINGPNIITTKTDVLDFLPEIKLCNSYTYTGRTRKYNQYTLKNGQEINFFPLDSEVLYNCKPNYITMPGWEKATSNIKRYSDLPTNMKKTFKKVSELTGANILINSVGAERDQTIIKHRKTV